MKTSSLLAVFTIILLLSSCQSTKLIYDNNWPKEIISIDGDLSEWQQPLQQSNSQVNIRYRTANDSQFLYLAVHIPDEYLKALVLNQGCKIWIDSSGKRKEKFGIGYPIPVTESAVNELSMEAKGDNELFKKLFAESLSDFDMIGLADEPLRASNLTSREIKVATGFDQLNGLVLELRVPIKSIFDRKPFFIEIISLGIEVNPLKKSLGDDTNDGSLFNDHNTNGITQSNPMMGPSPNQQMINNQSQRPPSMPNIWFKVKLNNNSNLP